MAIHKQFEVGEVEPTPTGEPGDVGYRFAIAKSHGRPLLSIMYRTEDEAVAAREAIKAALAMAVEVATRGLEELRAPIFSALRGMALKRGLYLRRVEKPAGHYCLIDRHGAEHPKWGTSFALADVEAFLATLTVTNPSALPLSEMLIDAGTRQQDAAP